jgi:predicted RNase H-like HicB family nuclease
MSQQLPEPSPVSDIFAARLQQAKIAQLEQRLRALEDNSLAAAYTVPIASFAPEPYNLKKDIPVVVQQTSDDEYLASFADANINTSGDTQQEAFENLRSLILDMYQHLRSLPKEKLGPRLAARLAVLRDFIDESS